MSTIVPPKARIESAARAARLREWSGQIIQPLEQRYLSPYRERGHGDPFLATNATDQIKQGLLDTYRFASLATVCLAEELGMRANEILVVPSLLLHYPNRDPGSTHQTKVRVHNNVGGALREGAYSTDCYTRGGNDCNEILTQFKHKFSPATLREFFVDKPSTRTQWLTDRHFLPFLSMESSTWSTGQYFTDRQMQSGEAIVFSADDKKHPSGGFSRCITVSDGFEGVVKEAEEKLEGDGHVGLEKYLMWVRWALGVDSALLDQEVAQRQNWTEQINADPNGSNNKLMNSVQHRHLVAISCFDPVIGRSDGTLVLYLREFPSEDFLRVIGELVVPILTRFGRFDEALADYRRIRSQAMRAAVSGILARSMAHDVGSHMLADFRLLPIDAQDTTELADATDRFAYLKNYLRERMVWLAEATSGDPFWSEPLMLWEEVLKPFKESPVAESLLADQSVTEIEIKATYNNRELDEEDLAVDIPTGIVGKHALYAILENILRNAVRHNPKRSDRITLTIELADSAAHPELLTMKVFEDFTSPTKELLQEIKQLCDPKENNGDQGPLVDASGHRINNGLGIKEMRVGAAWLRGGVLQNRLHGEESQQHGNDPPLLRPILDGGRFGYEIHVNRPAELLLVSREVTNLCTDQRVEGLRKQGFGLQASLSADDLAQLGRYRVLLVDLSGSGDKGQSRWFLDEKSPHLPMRTLVYDGNSPENGGVDKKYFKAIVDELKKGKPPYAELATALWRREESESCLWVQLEDAIIAGQWQGAADRLKQSKGPDAVVSNEPPSDCDDGKILFYKQHEDRTSASSECYPFKNYFPSTSPLYSALKAGPRSIEQGAYFLWELMEAALLDVVIADERLEKYRSGDGLDLAGITIENFKVPAKPTKDELKAMIEEACEPCTILVHLGLLESAFAGDRQKITEWCSCVSRGRKRLVVMTDRGGDSSNLPGSLRYLPYSVIAGSITGTTLGKHTLARTIFSSVAPIDDSGS